MNHLKTVLAVAACAAGPALATAAQQPLPWEREILLREAAQTTLVQGILNATDPGRSAMSINNLKMHTVMWGPPNRITISINKNNVWDRRLHEFQAPTLQEITEGAFSPANKDYIGVKETDSITFDLPDLVELAPLADKLANKGDPLSASVVARLDDKSKASLAAFEADRTNYRLGRELLTNLTAGLNIAISGPPLYDAKLFAIIRLRPDTESLRQRNPQGSERRRLNRLLLEDVYPEISKRPGNSLRPFDLGWLSKEGGSVDPYRYPMRYAFPCLKPVGQIILGIDPLEGATAPRISQSCANGVTSLQVTKGDAKADLQYVLEMAKDVYAIRGNLSGIDTPVWLRLYRHRDTAHLDYMTPDGKYTKPAAEKDKAFNGPIEPPTSGQDGRYFWIRQKMPVEKTFPQGFEYVLMGVIKGQGEMKIEAVTNQLHLGTPPPNPPMPWDWFGASRPSIAEAPGAAATATFKAGTDGQLEAFVTVVTTMDGPDLVAEARKRLADAEKAGFDGAVQENTTWWNAFYDKRENGRIFQGSSGTACTENVRALYQQSWTDSHGGGTKTDMRLLECSASYALPERDIQDFDGAPCYNEVFPTSRYVRNWDDSEDMWLQIVQHWPPGAQQNARDRFNMPGMCITHGYCPPVKPDKYVHEYARTHNGESAKYFGLTFWTPNMNIFRDPRWGRGQETYGEDPFLTARMAVAFITGLQGDDPKYAKAMACAKHFAVHSGPESTRHTFDAVVPERDFYETYLPHFEAAVREGKVWSVMGAYNSVYVEPACSSTLLLSDLLRKQWGFRGHIVSDCGAIFDIFANHKRVPTDEEGSARAVKAGCDMCCGDDYSTLPKAVRQGLISEAEMDVALGRLLASRFRLGLFDPPAQVAYARIPFAANDTDEHHALALRAARESMVLLKNNGVLPLNRARLKRLAVIGTNACSVEMMLGNYSGTPSKPVTILEGIKARAGPGIEVIYDPGCPLAVRKDEPAKPARASFAAATRVAASADVVIYVGGLNPQLEGEEMPVDYLGFGGGDRTDIALPAVQDALLKALHATGKPVVFVNCSGSAVAMVWAAEHLPAILQAWYPGGQGGQAVAETLFGDANPAGRLPVTFYRSTAELPLFEDYRMSHRTYRYFTGKPLFAFGHGLSYTEFALTGARLGSAKVGRSDSVRLAVDVKNSGQRAGDEVVQVYFRHVKPSQPQPRLALCAFTRVNVPPGKTVPVSLEIPVERFRFWDTATKSYAVEPGAYEILIGSASDKLTQRLSLAVR